jgi:bifunctional DNase/RNase
MALVEMSLQRVVINETSDQQYIFLKEKGGERSFPIVIGYYEALAIDRFVNEAEPQRPMTHDLLSHMVEALGGRVAKVDVTNLKDSTFYAVIHLRAEGGRAVEVDARPSDAIALATATKAPIFVSDEVLGEAALS